MYRIVGILLLCSLGSPLWAGKTPLDLMVEGRYKEAKAIIENSNISPRYQLIYYALLEADASRACSLYQVIAIRYPNTDCDSVARARLNLAQEMGFIVVPVNEWADAGSSVKPIELRRPESAKPAPAPTLEFEATHEPIVEEEEVPDTVGLEEESFVSETVGTDQEIVQSERTEQSVESSVEEAVKNISIAVSPPPVSVAASSQSTEMIATPDDEETNRAEEEPTVMDVIPASPTSAPEETAVSPAAPQGSTVEANETFAIEEEPAITAISQPSQEVVLEKATPSPTIPNEPTAESYKETAEKEEPIIPEKPAVIEPEVKESTPTVKETSVQPSAETFVPNDRPLSNGHIYIQVGAFANFDNAHRLAKELQKAGFPVKLVMRENADRKLLQVRVGGYKDRAALDSVKIRLANEFNLPTVVVTE